jgi:hypothetical protein
VQSCACFHIPHSQPALLPVWFEARQLHARGGWDRIYRGKSPLSVVGHTPRADWQVAEVTLTTAPEWATYICQVYGGLPNAPWLLALVGRPGWHHYVVRQVRNIVAARSMYIHHDGMAWFGIDAPVPGLMAPTFDLDALLCHTMVRDGLAWGVRYFIADIEAPSTDMDTPAYHHFAALGFKRPYFRSHYCR